MTFDYEKAWLDLMLPAYKELPAQIHVLLENVAIDCAELGQLRDCSMPWPDDGGKLREQFNRVSDDVLSLASHVVYFYGHWKPGASVAGDAPAIPGANHGASWKFSHYADQILRPRFGLPENGNNPDTRIQYKIIEGAIRVCYSSRDSWTWHEVAPATKAGMEIAEKAANKIRRAVDAAPMKYRESAAYAAMEAIKTMEPWERFSTKGYIVEESELAARMPKPDKDKLRAEVLADFEREVAKETTERNGKLWLIEHDIPTGNAIFYSHTGQWCFGWSKPYTGEAREKLLGMLVDFPFSYDVK